MVTGPIAILAALAPFIGKMYGRMVTVDGRLSSHILVTMSDHHENIKLMIKNMKLEKTMANM